MTTKTLKELTDELRTAQGYADESVGDPGFDYYHRRVVAIRDELYNHPDAVAMALRNAHKLEERRERYRIFYADPANRGRICI